MLSRQRRRSQGAKEFYTIPPALAPRLEQFEHGVRRMQMFSAEENEDSAVTC